MISGAEVQQHDSAESCWIVVHGRAYDVTGEVANVNCQTSKTDKARRVP
jgi:hypothetical protein